MRFSARWYFDVSSRSREIHRRASPARHEPSRKSFTLTVRHLDLLTSRLFLQKILFYNTTIYIYSFVVD